MSVMEYRICEEKDSVYVSSTGETQRGLYIIKFKNILGFWCKYRLVPDWSPSPGSHFVVTYKTRDDAQSVITALQNGSKCNKSTSMITESVILAFCVVTVILGIIAALQ